MKKGMFRFGLLFVMLCFVINMSKQYASAADIYTISQLLSSYEANSPSINQIQSYYENKSLDYLIQEEEINNLPAGTLAVFQIAQNNLNLDLNRYYNLNKDFLITEKTELAKTNFLSSCLSTAISSSQAAYYASKSTYYNTAYTIESIKLSNGYSLPSTVNVLKSQADLAKALYLATLDSTAALDLIIEENTGLSNVQVDMDALDAKRNYDLQALISLFSSSNPDTSLLESNISAYSTFFYSIDSIAGVSDLFKSKINMTIQNYQDQLNEIMIMTRIYTTQVYFNYQSSYTNMLAYRAQMNALSDKYDAAIKTYQLGKCTKLDVDKAHMDFAEASYNYYIQVKNVFLYQYILDNGVYGFNG